MEQMFSLFNVGYSDDLYSVPMSNGNIVVEEDVCLDTL